MKVLQNVQQTSRLYYTDRRQTSDDSTKVGWKNTYAQEIRFQQFLRSFNFNGQLTINDLGCGLAGFYSFFTARYPEVETFYNGYDILPEMVEEASQKYAGLQNVNIRLIKSADDMSDADFVFASGIFNLKFELSDNDWYDYITTTVRTMFDKCTKGISFNCLTSYSDKEFMKPELYYTNPAQLFDFCKKNLSKNVALYHDYNEYDFTISVIKTY